MTGERPAEPGQRPVVPGERPPRTGDKALDPGAYIGQEPELATETLPELGPDDERVAAYGTQGTGVGRPDLRGQVDEPQGHRAVESGADTLREAGQNR